MEYSDDDDLPLAAWHQQQLQSAVQSRKPHRVLPDTSDAGTKSQQLRKADAKPAQPMPCHSSTDEDDLPLTELCKRVSQNGSQRDSREPTAQHANSSAMQCTKQKQQKVDTKPTITEKVQSAKPLEDDVDDDDDDIPLTILAARWSLNGSVDAQNSSRSPSVTLSPQASNGQCRKTGSKDGAQIKQDSQPASVIAKDTKQTRKDEKTSKPVTRRQSTTSLKASSMKQVNKHSSASPGSQPTSPIESTVRTRRSMRQLQSQKSTIGTSSMLPPSAEQGPAIPEAAAVKGEDVTQQGRRKRARLNGTKSEALPASSPESEKDDKSTVNHPELNPINAMSIVEPAPTTSKAASGLQTENPSMLETNSLPEQAVATAKPLECKQEVAEEAPEAAASTDGDTAMAVLQASKAEEGSTVVQTENNQQPVALLAVPTPSAVLTDHAAAVPAPVPAAAQTTTAAIEPPPTMTATKITHTLLSGPRRVVMPMLTAEQRSRLSRPQLDVKQLPDHSGRLTQSVEPQNKEGSPSRSCTPVPSPAPYIDGSALPARASRSPTPAQARPSPSLQATTQQGVHVAGLGGRFARPSYRETPDLDGSGVTHSPGPALQQTSSASVSADSMGGLQQQGPMGEQTRIANNPVDPAAAAMQKQLLMQGMQQVAGKTWKQLRDCIPHPQNDMQCEPGSQIRLMSSENLECSNFRATLGNAIEVLLSPYKDTPVDDYDQYQPHRSLGTLLQTMRTRFSAWDDRSFVQPLPLTMHIPHGGDRRAPYFAAQVLSHELAQDNTTESQAAGAFSSRSPLPPPPPPIPPPPPLPNQDVEMDSNSRMAPRVIDLSPKVSKSKQLANGNDASAHSNGIVHTSGHLREDKAERQDRNRPKDGDRERDRDRERESDKERTRSDDWHQRSRDHKSAHDDQRSNSRHEQYSEDRSHDSKDRGGRSRGMGESRSEERHTDLSGSRAEKRKQSAEADRYTDRERRSFDSKTTSRDSGRSKHTSQEETTARDRERSPIANRDRDRGKDRGRGNDRDNTQQQTSSRHSHDRTHSNTSLKPSASVNHTPQKASMGTPQTHDQKQNSHAKAAVLSTGSETRAASTSNAPKDDRRAVSASQGLVPIAQQDDASKPKDSKPMPPAIQPTDRDMLAKFNQGALVYTFSHADMHAITRRSRIPMLHNPSLSGKTDGADACTNGHPPADLLSGSCLLLFLNSDLRLLHGVYSCRQDPTVEPLNPGDWVLKPASKSPAASAGSNVPSFSCAVKYHDVRHFPGMPVEQIASSPELETLYEACKRHRNTSHKADVYPAQQPPIHLSNYQAVILWQHFTSWQETKAKSKAASKPSSDAPSHKQPEHSNSKQGRRDTARAHSRERAHQSVSASPNKSNERRASTAHSSRHDRNGERHRQSRSPTRESGSAGKRQHLDSRQARSRSPWKRARSHS